MIIDIVYCIVLLLAVFKGYSKGFVVAVFSFFAIFIGLAAAMKLSVLVAGWLGKNTGIGTRLLPVIAFAVVMVGVALLVRLCALMIEKILKLAMLGFINKLAGILLYFIIYTIVYSVVLFFANKISLLKQETIAASRCYGFIAP